MRATVDSLVTFAITDPYRFVYNISADDFDHVFQAVCQEALRALVRTLPSERVSDLAGQDKGELRAAIGETVAAYGVEVRTTVITFAQPPAGFVRSEEARQLAVLQRAEQTERQILAQLRQTNEEALVRQQALARVAREQDTLQAEAQRGRGQPAAWWRRRRPSRPCAWPAWKSACGATPRPASGSGRAPALEVARSLAGNTRAVLQVGNANQIARALVVRDVIQDQAPVDRPRDLDRSDGDVSGGPPWPRRRTASRVAPPRRARPGATRRVTPGKQRTRSRP